MAPRSSESSILDLPLGTHYLPPASDKGITSDMRTEREGEK